MLYAHIAHWRVFHEIYMKNRTELCNVKYHDTHNSEDGSLGFSLFHLTVSSVDSINMSIVGNFINFLLVFSSGPLAFGFSFVYCYIRIK